MSANVTTQPVEKSTPFQIGMLVFPGMTSLDFAGPLDVFARLPHTNVCVLAKSLDPVVTDIGLRELPSMRMADAPPLDLLFIGGGPGVNALMEDEETISFLTSRAPHAQYVTSVCTGALVLGAAGLLRGYKATTHWAAMDVLRYFGAEPVPERVVIDRNRITGGGVTAGIDFALTIAAHLHGRQQAEAMQLGMEYDPRPPFPGGTATTSSPALVAALRERMAAGTQTRVDIAKRVAGRNGWL